MIFKRVSNFIENNDCLYSLQFGFRAKYSTTHALISITEKIRNALDQNKVACGIFVDLQKAFDTVNREILWDILWDCGVRGKMWRVLRSLFTGFRGRVKAQGSLSPFFEILQGVIQGSRLGPLLFNIFFKSLIDKIKKMKGAEF